MIQAFWAIVALAMVLVLMNVRWLVRSFAKDKNRARLVVYLVAFTLFGAYLIKIAYAMMDKITDTEIASQEAEVEIGRYSIQAGEFLLIFHRKRAAAQKAAAAAASHTDIP